MAKRTLLAAAVAILALPGLAETASAAPHHRPGHPGAPHGGHPGAPHGGHPGRPRPGRPGHPMPPGHRVPGPHPGYRPGPHPGYRPHGGIVPPRIVFRGGRRVIIRPYPVPVGGPGIVVGPAYGGGYPAAGPGYGGIPAAGGCSTRRYVSLTSYGWHKIVTVTTCFRP